RFATSTRTWPAPALSRTGSTRPSGGPGSCSRRPAWQGSERFAGAPQRQTMARRRGDPAMEGGVKIGNIWNRNVGCACAMAAVKRGSAREIVLVNRDRKTAEAVATDMRYGTPLGPKVDIVDGDYDDLKGAGIVLITVGVNEKTGGATDRNDPLGRLKLLDKNAEIYRDIVP